MSRGYEQTIGNGKNVTILISRDGLKNINIMSKLNLYTLNNVVYKKKIALMNPFLPQGVLSVGKLALKLNKWESGGGNGLGTTLLYLFV